MAPSKLLSIAFFLGLICYGAAAPEWGFFGHRRLNRLAVFTLDADMMPFFRDHIEFLTDHAVDPDKRRYATKHEAVRHYIDIDHWGKIPYANVPRRWTDALIYRATFTGIRGADTTVWRVDTITHATPEERFWNDSRVLWTDGKNRLETQLGATRTFFNERILPQYYEEERRLPVAEFSLFGWPGGADAGTVVFDEHFTEYGILPYHLLSFHYRLQRAFEAEDPDAILRISAEMGHYVGDAHVPLHTTENYNGQMTGQTGIHAFWESRLPELFADADYDYFVGPAEYISDPRSYYWDMVMDSHALVDSVFRTEARLRREYPADQQMCYDERLGRETLTQCAEFAAAWDAEMQGMVEARFRDAILAIGSVWYTCWVDAGQPDLTRLAPSAERYAARDTLPVRVTPGRIHE